MFVCVWKKSVWVSIEDSALVYGTHCPFDYCNITAIGRDVNLQDDSDSQCAFNRAGRLCGGCKDNYSLAIGSSHCIHCPDNNNLALLIFFAAAGFLLVFFTSAFTSLLLRAQLMDSSSMPILSGPIKTSSFLKNWCQILCSHS